MQTDKDIYFLNGSFVLFFKHFIYYFDHFVEEMRDRKNSIIIFYSSYSITNLISFCL